MAAGVPIVLASFGYGPPPHAAIPAHAVIRPTPSSIISMSSRRIFADYCRFRPAWIPG
jgi:hypothetical protein